MSGYTLADVQAVNTLLIAEVDRICRKHGITYFVSEGTLLGAIRHGGPIPWDDDADLSMPRESFERFKAIAPSELGPEFEFSTPDDYGDKGFHDFIPHLNYLPSHMYPDDERMAFYRGKLNHIRLDFFIIDGATTGFSQTWRRARLLWVYGLSWAHRYAIDYADYTGAQKIGVFILSHLGKLHKQTALNARYDRIMQSAPADAPCRFLGNTLVQELDRTYRREWYSPVIDVDFDGHRFMAPAGYDNILTELYGDWRTLPPVEKRVSPHFMAGSPDFWIDGWTPVASISEPAESAAPATSATASESTEPAESAASGPSPAGE